MTWCYDAGIIIIMWHFLGLVLTPVVVMGFFFVVWLVIELHDADKTIDRLTRESAPAEPDECQEVNDDLPAV